MLEFLALSLGWVSMILGVITFIVVILNKELKYKVLWALVVLIIPFAAIIYYLFLYLSHKDTSVQANDPGAQAQLQPASHNLGKKLLKVFIGFLVLAGLVWAGLYFLNKSSNKHLDVVVIACDAGTLRVADHEVATTVGPAHHEEMFFSLPNNPKKGRFVDEITHYPFPAYLQPENFKWFASLTSTTTPADYSNIYVNSSQQRENHPSTDQFTLAEYKTIETCIESHLPELNSQLKAHDWSPIGSVTFVSEQMNDEYKKIKSDYNSAPSLFSFKCPSGDISITTQGKVRKGIDQIGMIDAGGFFVRKIEGISAVRSAQILADADQCTLNGQNIDSFYAAWRNKHTGDLVF
jgi:hypothetical protein